MTRTALFWSSFLPLMSLCLPLLAGPGNPSVVGDPYPIAGPIAEEGAPLTILEQYRQFRRDRMSPTDLPGATGSAQHPSQ